MADKPALPTLFYAFRVVVFVLLAPAAWLLDQIDAWIGWARFDRACNAAKGHNT